ncbi:hypothetical protein APY03_5823 [Variovorax sp. WDL1]|nr:hypothetical protein APY03_5823 [Variovorax sp. WDL1]
MPKIRGKSQWKRIVPGGRTANGVNRQAHRFEHSRECRVVRLQPLGQEAASVPQGRDQFGRGAVR